MAACQPGLGIPDSRRLFQALTFLLVRHCDVSEYQARMEGSGVSQNRSQAGDTCIGKEMERSARIEYSVYSGFEA